MLGGEPFRLACPEPVEGALRATFPWQGKEISELVRARFILKNKLSQWALSLL